MRADGDAPEASDFLASIRDFDGLNVKVQTDLLAYYLLTVLGRTHVTASSLEELRQRLGLRPHNHLPVYLSTAANAPRGVVPTYVRQPKGYVLERSYQARLTTEYLGRPAAKNVAKDLRKALTQFTDADVHGYAAEAVACFEYGLFRAAVVLTWCLAYSQFRGWLFSNHLAAFNGQTGGWKVPFVVKNLDDFQELQEASVIDTARKAGLISKEAHKTLRQLLDQRNSYGHPSNKTISSSIAEAFVETALREVVLKFK